MQEIPDAVVPWFLSAAKELLATAPGSAEEVSISPALFCLVAIQSSAACSHDLVGQGGGPHNAESLYEQVVARALAKVTGHTVVRSRSLLSANEGFTTLQYRGDVTLDRPGFVFGFLRRKGVAEATVEEVLHITSCICRPCGCPWALVVMPLCCRALLTELVVPVTAQLKRMTMTADGKGAVFDVDSKVADEFMTKCGDTTSTDGHLITPTALPALKHKVRRQILSDCLGFGINCDPASYGQWSTCKKPHVTEQVGDSGNDFYGGRGGGYGGRSGGGRGGRGSAGRGSFGGRGRFNRH